ncbi:lipase class 3 [[Leptolyngbya] sp. PCC 7376]|uniref:lipase family protein n=1 Tax=[Leptolyngbya] sp. PCC 7376 TaxID=111781 RepID=UPI00029F4DFC|nr:lipase family protein [[Leptolyngbya] sp. PCC 7376]AFY37901.1 lipase class 3 [[Leptolyngbya] sp. PCC 7376]
MALSFNYRAKSLSKMNMLYLANCAKLVYQSKAKIESELTKLGFDLTDKNFFLSSTETDTQCFVAGDRRKIIVAFRGSERKIADWATNAKAIQRHWTDDQDDGKVHRGFYRALDSLWDELEKEIRNLRTDSQTLWITGHSLGGALATLAAARLHIDSPKIAVNGLYTFGQPRIGNNRFAKVFNSKLKNISFRCVNNNDVVTRVPPQIFNYSHIGKLMYFDAKGKLRNDRNLSWWSRFWDRVEGRYDDIFDLDTDGIGDHSMAEYERLAIKARKKR